HLSRECERPVQHEDLPKAGGGLIGFVELVDEPPVSSVRRIGLPTSQQRVRAKIMRNNLTAQFVAGKFDEGLDPVQNVADVERVGAGWPVKGLCVRDKRQRSGSGIECDFSKFDRFTISRQERTLEERFFSRPDPPAGAAAGACRRVNRETAA